MNIAILVFFCLAMSAIAQSRSALEPPTPQEQREAIARLRADLATYEQQAPDLVCRQPSLILNGSEVTQVSPNPRIIIFPEQTPQQHGQVHGLVKSFAIALVIHDLLSPEVQFSFVRWASVAWSPKTGRKSAGSLSLRTRIQRRYQAADRGSRRFRIRQNRADCLPRYQHARRRFPFLSKRSQDFKLTHSPEPPEEVAEKWGNRNKKTGTDHSVHGRGGSAEEEPTCGRGQSSLSPFFYSCFPIFPQPLQARFTFETHPRGLAVQYNIALI